MEREEIGARKLLQPIRVAITGTSISPGIFESLAALGRERSLQRLRAAIARLDTALQEGADER
jgi:glutamyl-tRNA synthetase